MSECLIAPPTDSRVPTLDEVNVVLGTGTAGEQYAYGMVCKKHAREQWAVWLFAAAAAKDHADATGELGMCYLAGSGVARDEERGDALLLKACDMGTAAAMWNRACRISAPEAARLCVRAAELGYRPAFYRAAKYLRSGYSVPKDEVRARDLLLALDTEKARYELERMDAPFWKRWFM